MRRRSAGALLWVLLWALVGPAWAWDVAAVPVHGPLQVGVPATVWVAVSDDQGGAMPGTPEVVGDAAVVWRLEAPTPPGVWPFAVVPTARSEAVSLTVTVDGRRRTVRLPVGAPLVSTLRAPAAMVADARDRRLAVVISGEDLPLAEHLAVAVSEGWVVGVEPVLLGLRVTVELADVPYPRLVVLGVRDTRGGAAPLWASVRLRSRLAVPVETEPGATVTVRIGGQTWGPVTADARGMARLLVEQDPDDRRAELVVRDVGGNETARELALSTVDKPLLVVMAGGALVSGEAPPALWVYAADAGGGPWTGEAPACRTPQGGVLTSVRVSPGRWAAALPPAALGERWDTRVRCAVSGLSEADVTVPLAPGSPVKLDMRLWPEELSADFPVSDLQVTLLDAAGERVEPAGRLTAGARWGTVQLREPTSLGWRGEYLGSIAAEVGQDEIVARWTPSVGEGAVGRVLLHVETVPLVGVATLWVRALDALGRPLAGAVVGLRTAAGEVAGRTDARGWARLAVAVPDGLAPVRVTVVTDVDAQFEAVVVRGTQGASPLEKADLEARLAVRVDPGRLATVELVATPNRVQPGGSSEIRARFLDRSDRVVARSSIDVTATEGRLLPLDPLPDGSVRWRWTTPPGFRVRQVQITARDATLDVEEEVNIDVRPAPVRGFLGVSGGVQTNFTGVVSPTAGVDFGVWLRTRGERDEERLLPSRLFLMGQFAWYRAGAVVESGVGPVGTVRMDLLPASLMLALRQEYPLGAFWVGVGGQAAGWAGSLRFDDDPYLKRGGVLGPALVAVFGGGVRVLGGELFLELRGSTLMSQGGDAMLSGPVGGLAAHGGFRVLWWAGGRRER